MHIEERVVGGVTVLDVNGKVTLHESAVLLTNKITSLVQRGHQHLVLNLERVPCVDSCGLGAIVGSHTIVSLQGGRLTLVNVAACLRHVLRITKLETVLEIFDSERDVLRGLSI